MSGLKDHVLRMLLWPGAPRPFAPLLRDRATVFFLHRFAVPDLGVSGHDPDRLRAWLAHLRRRRFELISLEEVFQRLESGAPFRQSVAFTIDDGYFDQATVAAPLFAEFDCPVTTFVATGFLDGALWMWWDRVDYAFRHTQRRRLVARLPDGEVVCAWQDDAGRKQMVGALVERLKRIPDAAKHAAIEALAAEAEVALPGSPPEAVRPMTWDELRRAEALGMRFGPHTVTHPILSQTPDEQSRRELEESWRRLQEEARSPVPIFCYPNGTLADFGERELRTLEGLGLRGGVLGIPGYSDRARHARPPYGRFLVHRFGYDERLPQNVQYAAGFERFKEIVRGGAAA